MSEQDPPMHRITGAVRTGARRLDLDGFRSFILRGNVVDLAVGIVIGAAFTAVVQSLVKDFITPLVSIPLGKASDFATRHWTLGGAQFVYGDFLNSVISLVLIGLVVYYFVVRPVNVLMERFKPSPAPATPTKVCPECKSSISAEATRCAFCTVVLPAASAS
ncbi:MAG TPA: large conductance mechanosensitive channel protein MscL [Mycobacteriales bacterium]|nr:large conductance mechanosensitive channel protein MscL [Mycobacteriales bacterium]HWB67274.1 large conductance mechanosensitive channel protein MscL [Mycobacteriales bacterium]